MDMKHTKGPWILWHTDLVINPDTGDNICQLFGGFDGKTMYDNYEANAKLIAAAPELLEALRLALPYVKGAYECAFPDSDQNENIAEAIETAIKKATE